MTKIDFYYDPICPFCWITSRWLLKVAHHRDIDINWRQFSLAIKNNSLELKDSDTDYTRMHRSSHRIHRVIRQAVDKYSASSIELYTEFGERRHIKDQTYDDGLIKEVLLAKKLPLELLNSADDQSIDATLENELNSAIEVAGEDIGVPTIVFTSKEGQKLGYFGPVLNELPDLEQSLAIWDGLEKLATTSSFYELKRTREGKPNTASTARET